jgi:hypothetical protein
MDHFNAMFEDSQTKSWWRQVNGEAIAGPLKGKTLPEIPSQLRRTSAPGIISGSAMKTTPPPSSSNVA